MLNIVFAILCLACAGQGRRVLAPAHSLAGNKIVETLLARPAAAAFNPQSGGAHAPQHKPGHNSPEMRLFGQPAVAKSSKKGLSHGVEHPDANSYANAFHELSDDESKAVKKDVLGLRSRVLGPDHPDTLRAMKDYGTALNNAAPPSPAENSLREMLERQRQVLKQKCEAEDNLDISLMKDILHLKLRRIGANDPDTLVSLANYADTLATCGRHAAAARMYRQLVDIRRQLLGAEHPDTLAALDSYADTLEELDREVEAEPLRKEAHLLTRLTFGPQHSETIKALTSYATTLCKLGRLDEAEPLWKEVFEVSRKNFGPDHPATVKALKLYSKTCSALGHSLEASEDQLNAHASNALNDYAKTIQSLSHHAEKLGLHDGLRQAEPRDPVVA
mmetsp:Transcript_108456/g.188267  ORF Transcript_108456/g.188267 Transcript_108456/m.188267 type:complete len:390 (+) Transcript_108456:79-1248(+)